VNGQKTGVRTITLNRPEKMNALTEEMGEAFEKATRELGQDDSLRYDCLSGYPVA
jgi:enoyl-CoA hydratase/carnithine racemase